MVNQAIFPCFTAAKTSEEDSVNLHIGRRLRRRRRLLGLTQCALGALLHMPFQSVQKYECAENRISAARLFSLAKALQVPVQYFYEGLGSAEAGAMPREPVLDANEAEELLTAYAALRPTSRQRLLELVKAL
jgi:transcriptional regulator with XRE-family HTH domain